MQLLIAVLAVLSICTSFATPQVSVECELRYTSTGSPYCCGQQGAGVVPVENEKYYGTCPPPLPLNDCPIVFSGVKPDIQADQQDNQFQNIRPCSTDFACANLEKCCFDPCSQLNWSSLQFFPDGKYTVDSSVVFFTDCKLNPDFYSDKRHIRHAFDCP